MKFKKPGMIVAKMIAVGMLFGALGRHYRDYYTLLRWIVFGVSVFTAWRTWKTDQLGWLRQLGWICPFVIVAAAFNPFEPLYLKRETWAFIEQLELRCFS